MPNIPAAVLDPDYPTSGVETFPQDRFTNSAFALATGDCRMQIFRPRRETPVSKVFAQPGLTSFNIGTGAVSKLKHGVWTVTLDTTGKLASIIPLLQTADQSANTATLFATLANGVPAGSEVSYVAANGLAATAILSPLQSYAHGWLIVTTGTITQQPTVYAGNCIAATAFGGNGLRPRGCRLTSLSDLPTSSTAVGSLSINGTLPFVHLRP